MPTEIAVPKQASRSPRPVVVVIAILTAMLVGTAIYTMLASRFAPEPPGAAGAASQPIQSIAS